MFVKEAVGPMYASRHSEVHGRGWSHYLNRAIVYTQQEKDNHSPLPEGTRWVSYNAAKRNGAHIYKRN